MMSKQEPLVSVVTPVHNGEEHLRECIESVLAQTYTHWDYAIVNNCSTDHTWDIAREYAARDPRIRVHNNEVFVRAIENHNIAFRQISRESKYCKLVAADDLLLPECLEKMVGLAEDHPTVAIVGAFGLAGRPGGVGVKVDWVGLPYPSTVVVGGQAACRLRLLAGPYIFGTPTAVLFRSDIVRSRPAFYNESNLHADSEACLELLGDHDFGFVNQILTFRRIREDSLTSFSESFNTYLPSILYELVTYGAKYLRKDELRHRIREHRRDYYRYLGEQVYRRRGRDFWRFHREKLADIGYPLNRGRLAFSAISYALDLMLNPKSTAERGMHKLCRLLSKRSSCGEAL